MRTHLLNPTPRLWQGEPARGLRTCCGLSMKFMKGVRLVEPGMAPTCFRCLGRYSIQVLSQSAVGAP